MCQVFQVFMVVSWGYMQFFFRLYCQLAVLGSMLWPLITSVTTSSFLQDLDMYFNKLILSKEPAVLPPYSSLGMAYSPVCLYKVVI